MSSNVSLVVCGDVGPARQVLLERRDLELFWTDSYEECLATLRHARPKLCLVRLKDENKLYAFLRNVRELGSMPCVVLLEPAQERFRSACTLAGASETALVDKSEQVLQVVSDFTGLQFAKDVRVDYQTVVEVNAGRDTFVLETSNISASGVAIRGFKTMPVGTPVELKFVGEHRLAPFRAHIVRCWNAKDVAMCGLRFARLDAPQLDWLKSVVHATSGSLPSPPTDLDALFSDLSLPVVDAGRALVTGDLSQPAEETAAPTGPQTGLKDQLAAFVRAAREGHSPPPTVSPWIEQAVEKLTQIEVASALDEPAPEWASFALNLRLRLFEWRAAHPRSPVPGHLADDAHRLFVALPTEASKCDDATRAQVSIIRAALLRDLANTKTRSRLHR